MAITENKSPQNEKTHQQNIPKDVYNITYILFFMTGLIHLLPWSFFTTAHEYWMYKLRDTSGLHDDDPDFKTNLQTLYPTFLSITLQVATIVALFFGLFFGHHFSIKFKLYGPVLITLLLFIVTAAFITIDTDTWQNGFFVIIIISVAVINIFNSFFSLGAYSVMSKFPTLYIGAYVTGEGLSSIFTSSLQILSLSMGLSAIDSALVYFWVGIGVVVFTIALAIAVMKYNKFFAHYYASFNAKIQAPSQPPTMQQNMNSLKKIWSVLAVMLCYLLSVYSIQPGITSMIVSEGTGTGEWHDVYFIPVVVFLIPGIAEFIGRTIASTFQLNINLMWFVVMSVIRLGLVPLVMLCNEQPRVNLPVIFPHDYQFILLLVIMHISGGYLACITYFSIPRLVPPEQLENAFHVNMVGVGVLLGITAPVSYVSVKLL